ncbi:MAG: chromosome partitioning protein ParB [Pirellulaceae bacterium]|nr:MAG: chromosome partitioning protein ParB [Pirellulaceae bacterium]
MSKDRRLGKGLAALLGTPLEEELAVEGAGTVTTPSSNGGGNAPKTAVHTAAGGAKKQVTGSVPLDELPRSSGPLELSVYEIDNNPFQPRRKFNEHEIASLAESIREHDQLQPILVRKVGERYQLISGERRLRAAIHAGLETIRAEVREADDRLVAELAIVENLQRKDLDAIEKALSFRRYLDQHGCTQEDLARRLKIDRSTIANLMRLLELPEEVQQWIQQEKLTAGHARALLPLGDEDLQIQFARQLMEEGWSVRETERRVGELLQAEEGGGSGRATSTRGRPNPQLAAIEQQLRLALGTKTEVKQTARGRGKITISFANAEEFERICHLICPDLAKHFHKAA